MSEDNPTLDELSQETREWQRATFGEPKLLPVALHLAEEALEVLVSVAETDQSLEHLQQALRTIGPLLGARRNPNAQELADEIADVEHMLEAVSVAAGVDRPKAWARKLREVNKRRVWNRPDEAGLFRHKK